MNTALTNRIALALGLALLVLGGPWFVGQLRSLPREGVGDAKTQRIVTLDVAGMTCDVCAASVRYRLAQVPGVARCDVRYAERRAFVVCDRAVADSALTSAVHRAGPGFLAAVAAR